MATSSTGRFKCPNCTLSFSTTRSLAGHFGYYPSHAHSVKTAPASGTARGHPNAPYEDRKRKASNSSKNYGPSALSSRSGRPQKSTSSTKKTKAASLHDDFCLSADDSDPDSDAHDDTGAINFLNEDSDNGSVDNHHVISRAAYPPIALKDLSPFAFAKKTYLSARRVPVVAVDDDSDNDGNHDTDSIVDLSNPEDVMDANSGDEGSIHSNPSIDGVSHAIVGDNTAPPQPLAITTLPATRRGPAPARNTQDVLTLDLIQLLRKAGAKLETYNLVLQWAHRAHHHQYNFTAPIPKRNLFISSFANQLGIAGMYPKSLPTDLPHANYSVDVTVFDVMAAIHSLLTDEYLMRDDNFLFSDPDNPFKQPPEANNICGDLTQSDWYCETYHQMSDKTPNSLLAGPHHAVH